MEEIINEIKSAAKMPNPLGDEILFSDNRYRSIPFSEQYFHSINLLQNEQELRDNKKRKLCFIDGGNCEIIKMPNLSVHLVRAACVIFEGNKKVKQEKVQHHVIAKFLPEKNSYSIKFIPEIIKGELIFSCMDETIRNGSHRAEISKMGEVARRFLELDLAINAISHLNEQDILIRDGTLQSSITGESIFLNELYKQSANKNVIVAAIAKSCSLLTKKGSSAVASLQAIAPKEKFYYYPCVEMNHPDHQANLFFAKLHEKSKYLFRIEFHKKSKFDVDEVFAALAENSKDVQLVGYPYGLIAADALAKVKENEAKLYRIKIMAQVGKDIENGINALNAHDFF